MDGPHHEAGMRALPLDMFGTQYVWLPLGSNTPLVDTRNREIMICNGIIVAPFVEYWFIKVRVFGSRVALGINGKVIKRGHLLPL